MEISMRGSSRKREDEYIFGIDAPGCNIVIDNPPGSPIGYRWTDDGGVRFYQRGGSKVSRLKKEIKYLKEKIRRLEK